MLRLLLAGVFALFASPISAEIKPDDALVFLDFEDVSVDAVKLHNAVKRVEGKYGGALEFRTSIQYAELPFDRKLDGLTEMSAGGWFFTRRQGEQYFFSRGLPEIGE